MTEEAIKFLKRNMKVTVIINDETRINRLEYPLKAIREAIVNALIHRDYSYDTEKAYISVYKFKDRIEITSPGGLYGSIKLEDLDNYSMLEARNSNIVRMLEEKGHFIENRHTGIKTMKREMEKHGLNPPEFVVGRGYFKVIFRNTLLIDEVSGQQSGQQSDVLEKYKNDVLVFCSNPRTSKEIREYLNISSRQYVSTNIITPLIKDKKLEYLNKKSINAKN